MHAPDKYLQHPVKQKQCVFSSIAIECPEDHDCPEAYILKGKKKIHIIRTICSLSNQEKEMRDLGFKVKGGDIYTVIYWCLVQYHFVDDKDGGVIWQE